MFTVANEKKISGCSIDSLRVTAEGLMHRKYCIFQTIYKTYLSPQILGGNGGASYSPNVAYIAIGEILCYLC